MSCKHFLALFLFLLAARATGGSDQDSTEKTIDLVIRTLASEEMQGRRHLTPGGAKAREWLVGWLQANGFQPAGADGGRDSLQRRDVHAAILGPNTSRSTQISLIANSLKQGTSRTD